MGLPPRTFDRLIPPFPLINTIRKLPMPDPPRVCGRGIPAGWRIVMMIDDPFLRLTPTRCLLGLQLNLNQVINFIDLNVQRGSLLVDFYLSFDSICPFRDSKVSDNPAASRPIFARSRPC
jgi:hypothetical protein